MWTMVKLDGSDRYRPALIFECNKIALRHDASSIGNRGEATSRPAMAQKYSALLGDRINLLGTRYT